MSIFGVLKVVRTLAGTDPLTWTSKPPLRLSLSIWKRWWKPGIKNYVVGKDESTLVSATIKVLTFSEIKQDIFLNLFQTEFIFRYEKIIFSGFFKCNFFLSVISEWLCKALTSSLINAPLRPVIIQSNSKDFTNLHKFFARATFPFLFRCILLYLDMISGYSWVIVVFKFIINIIDLFFKIFIFLVYYAGDCNFYGVIFVNFFYCIYQFLYLF